MQHDPPSRPRGPVGQQVRGSDAGAGEPKPEHLVSVVPVPTYDHEAGVLDQRQKLLLREHVVYEGEEGGARTTAARASEPNGAPEGMVVVGGRW